MENERLQIISDTGGDSQFQMTTLYPEQFMEIFNTIQSTKDICLNDVEVKHQSIKDKLLEYNLHIIDILNDNRLELELKLDKLCTELKEHQNESDNKIVSLYEEIYEIDSRLKCFKEKQENVNILLFENFSILEKSINEQIESLKLKDIDILIIIRSMREELKQEIGEIRNTQQGIIKPWYKRIFSK